MTGGQIPIDGSTFVRDAEVAASGIGMVTQETVLFDDSVQNKHRLWSGAGTRGRWEPPRGGARFIMALPNRYGR
jgi:hypothetical protein